MITPESEFGPKHPAVEDLAERLGIPVAEAERALSALEAQANVTRKLLMRRIAEAWPEGQRKA